MPRLLSLDRFASIFEPLIGQRVGVVDGIGNIGDVLLYAATRQLLDAFGVEHATFNPWAGEHHRDRFNKLLLFAGGSIGYAPCTAIRRAAIETGIPCWVLPQSVLLFEEQPWERIFLRDSVSLGLMARGELAPDLALGFDFPPPPPPGARVPHGLFLRRHGHALFAAAGGIDPAEICHTVVDYCQLAARYQCITTDRLHFAITALGMGCQVNLLPVAYHKNRAIWEVWLRDLGCQWQDAP